MALKVGLVGCGGIGKAHADSYEKDPLGTLVAVCDVNRERADSFAERYKVRAYYTVQEMLKHEDLDIVDVTTSGYEQGSMFSARSPCRTILTNAERWCDLPPIRRLALVVISIITSRTLPQKPSNTWKKGRSEKRFT